jgi:hypothetical protein
MSALCFFFPIYEGVSKSFRTGRLERELQMVKLSATRCSCIAILWVSLVSFAAITLCVASQRVFIVVVVVYFVIDQSGNFWIHRRMLSFCKFSFLCRTEISPHLSSASSSSHNLILTMLSFLLAPAWTVASRLGP